jgi:hypothetical protein
MTFNWIKRSISFTVFGLGILGGLVGCVGYAGASFFIGANDSSQEIWALTFAYGTPLLACILALWRRLIAGSWLIFSGCFFVYGMVYQRTYMIQVRHFPDQSTVQQTIRSALPISLALIGIGLFGVITDLLKWPKLLGKAKPSSPDADTVADI